MRRAADVMAIILHSVREATVSARGEGEMTERVEREVSVCGGQKKTAALIDSLRNNMPTNNMPRQTQVTRDRQCRE